MLNNKSMDEFFKQLTETNRSLMQSWMAAAPAGDAAAPPVNPLPGLMQSHPLTAPHADFYKQQLDLWLSLIGAKEKAPVVIPEKGDRRFNSPEWEQPLFDYIKQNYLLTSRWMLQVVHQSHSDETAREKMSFFTRQYVDAMSPANFAFTNPEVMKLAVESKGESLQEGMKKLMEDIQKGTITMTDESQFEVGKNLGISPGQVVFENELFQLLQYTPSTPQVYTRPLLIVPPCVNKYYIMDLQPDNSLVGYAVSQGFKTFLISWKSVTPEMGHLEWDDYVEQGVITATDVVRKIGKAEKINVLSFCIGGELVSTAMSVMQARDLDWYESVTLMTVMIDHTDPGDIKHFIDWNLIRKREAQMAEGGVIGGKELSRTFSALRSNDLIWNYVVNNYLKGKTPAPFDLLYWNNDSANLALPMHTFFLRNMYLENNLTKPNSFSLCGVPIDLTKLNTPTYIFAAREDHIVPWQSAYLSTRIFKGPLRYVLGASGHIAGAINPVKANKRNYWVNEDLSGTSEEWLSGAESRPGSWWQDWSQWLTPFSGEKVAASKTHGNAAFKPIEPAPGRYVKERLD